GQTWSNPGSGQDRDAPFRLPSYIRFSLDQMEIDNTQSIGNDTDLVWLSYSAGKWPTQTDSTGPLEVNNGIYQLDRNFFNPIALELCEPVVFLYMIVNSSHTDPGNVFSAIEKGGEDYVNELLKALANPDSNAVASNPEAGLAIAGAAALVGSLLGGAAGALLG